MRLDDTLDGYWLSKRRNMSEHTIQDYSIAFRRLGEFLGDVEFEKITADHINQFLGSVEEKYDLSPKTIQNYWAALSSLWTWAEKALDAKHVIRGRVERPKVRRKQVQPYRESEVRALLEACDRTLAWRTPNGVEVESHRTTALRDKAIIMVLVDTGLRVSELCDLQIRDYDKKNGQLLVRHGKGDKQRIVYLGESAQLAVWRYLVERFPDARGKGRGRPPDVKLPPDEYLFVPFSGGQLDRSNLLHIVMRLGEKAGVPGANIHRFRHTFAVTFLRNGGNLFSLQAALGHEQSQTCKTYLALVEADQEVASRAASPADNWKL